MININLLPPEYRKAESTPITRFIAIVAGAVLVTSTLVWRSSTGPSSTASHKRGIGSTPTWPTGS